MTLNKILKNKKVPDSSIILKDFGKTDYCDSCQTAKITDENVDKITTGIFNLPEWVHFLMNLRNSLVSFIGLKTGDKNNVHIAGFYPVGSKAVYFTVTDRSDSEIIMEENDTHLKFRVSVMAIKKNGITTIYLTTIVKFNNRLGRIYFFIVKPFHRIIIQTLVKRV